MVLEEVKGGYRRERGTSNKIGLLGSVEGRWIIICAVKGLQGNSQNTRKLPMTSYGVGAKGKHVKTIIGGGGKQRGGKEGGTTTCQKGGKSADAEKARATYSSRLAGVFLAHLREKKH